MDTYSYGMILWELWHESIPFNNDISMAVHYVITENSRPKIVSSINDLLDESEDDDDKKLKFDITKKEGSPNKNEDSNYDDNS